MASQQRDRILSAVSNFVTKYNRSPHKIYYYCEKVDYYTLSARITAQFGEGTQISSPSAAYLVVKTEEGEYFLFVFIPHEAGLCSAFLHPGKLLERYVR